MNKQNLFSSIQIKIEITNKEQNTYLYKNTKFTLIYQYLLTPQKKIIIKKNGFKWRMCLYGRMAFAQSGVYAVD